MNALQIAVIINPVAGGGHGGKAWQMLRPGLQALFDKIDFRISNRVEDLRALSVNLLNNEPDYFLVIGGDGTLSEALNGFYLNDVPARLKTRFAYFNAGCGGDFARLFPKQYATEFLDRLIHDRYQHSNVGKMQFADSIRYFINIASCGLSAQVVKASEHSPWLKKMGGTFYYLARSLMEILSYRPQRIQIQIDNHPVFIDTMMLLAICNGQYFGGKIHVAPMARQDDGLLDVVMFLDYSRWSALFKLAKVYGGRHLHEKKVRYCQAKTVHISTPENTPIYLEADGELVGQLPVTISVLPELLPIVV